MIIENTFNVVPCYNSRPLLSKSRQQDILTDRRVLLTVGGASVCCVGSSRLHSHGERARSVDVRDAVASSLDVTDFVAVLDQVVNAERGGGVLLPNMASACISSKQL